ncbi:DmsC/YnfH family molybdoenzyme membrane anchor subunit [Gordonibacter massiliensis (ex Traore et al. 2017)]|uniref:DmsC/YnfH family molybdoenzyme membrane anchor subunit n=1 Tax=Gordonibacter massiliensis (ex Traore et al. 2017) TaxID=1841863 RepID=UPI0021B08725|nr:DmsC/YnfH family molybdoenzyme membrane anchor subunit [Gordonibacter massiliensis (ex Traore et al. 2017)]
MELVYSEVPLALFTTFSLIGTGAFMALALLVNVSRLERKHLKNIDALSVMPGFAVVLGLVAAYFGFQDCTNAVVSLRDLGGAARFAVVAYCLRAGFGGLAEGWRKFLLGSAGALGLLFVCVIGVVHAMVPDPAWNTLATPAQILGFALLGGSALATMMFEKAGALGGCPQKRTLTVFAILGTMLGVGGFVAQVATVSSMVGAGADLVRAASLHITVALFCLVATFVFEMMAIRMKETGFHSVVAVACSFVGVFCARLVFYTLQAA